MLFELIFLMTICGVLGVNIPTTVDSKHRLLFLGDSFTSCNRVRRDFRSAQLSFRRPLWTLLKMSGHEGSVEVVGPRSGCNAHVDKNLAELARFPKFHDAFFGRTLSSLVPVEQGHPDPLRQSLELQPTVVVLLIGMNDFTLGEGKNPQEVIGAMGKLVLRMLSAKSLSHLLILTVPSIDLRRFRKRKHFFFQVQKNISNFNRLLLDGHHLKNNQIKITESVGSQRHLLLDPNNAEHRLWVEVVDIASNYIAENFTYDGMHPNDSGEEHIARVVFHSLIKIFRDRRRDVQSSLPESEFPAS